MHMVIYALVEALTEDEALAAGKTVFDRLVSADPRTLAPSSTTTSHSTRTTPQLRGKRGGETFRLQPRSTPTTAKT